MQQLKPLQWALIGLAGLIALIAISGVSFYYNRRQRRKDLRASLNADLSALKTSGQPETTPSVIPAEWMKFSKPTLRLKHSLPPLSQNTIDSETVKPYLEIGLESDPLYSTDGRTRDKAALQLLENIVHQQALASASVRHDFEQFIHTVVLSFFAAVRVTVPFSIQTPHPQGSSWSEILQNGCSIIGPHVADASTDITANHLRTLIENYRKANPDSKINDLIISLEKA